MMAPDSTTVAPSAGRPTSTTSPPVDAGILPRLKAVPRELARLALERGQAEAEARVRRDAKQSAADAAHAEARATVEARSTSATASARAAADAGRARVAGAYEADSAAARDEHQKARRAILGRFRSEKEEADAAQQHARWEAGTVFEAAERGTADWQKAATAQLAEELQSLTLVRDTSDALLGRYRNYLPPAGSAPAAESPPPAPDGEPLPALQAAIEEADGILVRIEKLNVLKLLARDAFPILVFGLWVAAAGPLAYLMGIRNGLIAGTVVAAVLAVVVRSWLVAAARAKLGALVPPFRADLARADALGAAAKDWIAATAKSRHDEARTRRDAEIRKADRVRSARLDAIEARRDADAKRIDEEAERRLAEVEARRASESARVEAEATRRLAEIEERHRRESDDVEAQHRRLRDEARARYDAAYTTLADRWKVGIEAVRAEVAEVRGAIEPHSPNWNGDGDAAESWTPAEATPPGVRVGELRLDLGLIPHGLSDDPVLKAMAPEVFAAPLPLAFPDRGSLLLVHPAEGREAAVKTLQAAMLRYLTGLPPGKVRFTILDPVGLGRNFAAFMHLADYSEQLVTSRIWTEPQQIDQRLADLSLHMENVIQQFLRNEYATLEEYNAQAGEVAEPYRVLVVADFPAHFSEATARRLASIATSGARCGVYTLISVDKSQTPPPGFALKDLEPHAVTLQWKGGRFVVKDRDLEAFPLALDEPPPPEAMTRLLHRLGAAARDASRVEVPFEVVAPPPDRYWRSDSSDGFAVPLGRAGATKLQNLKLGKGTSQHALIAGRTGSGKSTMLHALITNTALMYSPDQVELYLIDFKKGVEFKTYAQHELPHARVVAIESEREFGLSVLQRLDAELKVRGDLFRDAGVQDLPGYRRSAGAGPMPRILLIVDEFQEFFVEDDKVAQDAALLLDRLVRQGRAFGIHVNLGSQTLSGAYTLARSTLGQMAVRVALQCSEADAHLILSEDNAAARLLSRPGEAIYNDANGLVEGNSRFQVVWLPDSRREVYLERVRELARERGFAGRGQIVFEGNVPADLRKNNILRDRLAAPPAEPPRSVQAWLGEAVAIKDPTAAIFRRQGGNNLLVIGQDDAAARGLFVATLASLAAQYPAGAAAFFVLDATPDDARDFDVIGRYARRLPQDARVGGWRDAAGILADLAEEVERRQAHYESAAPSRFLFLFDLARFRDLRKSDDDFGFGGFGRGAEERKASPAQNLAAILREGPGVGVHAIVWCDTLNNATRAFDRASLREFEQRVLFQMSNADSSNLIDSPAANRLGPNRALYSSEEQGRLEKFRPYGLPADDWFEPIAAAWTAGLAKPSGV